MNDLVRLCLALGAHKAANIRPTQLRFSTEFLDACRQNLCGRYGKNHTCPPHVGDITQLIARVKAYQNAVIFQTVHQLEDSFDLEGMQHGQDLHNQITFDAAQQAKAQHHNLLALNAGGCFLCKNCAAITHEPCRFPGQAISSLEAHGIDVSSIEHISDMKYINGPNTVTYFSGLFY